MEDLLIFDTETNGLRYPRMMQIAWIMNGEEKMFYISDLDENLNVEIGVPHNITKDYCKANGIMFNDMYNKFKQDILKSKKIMAYNIKFDIKVIMNELTSRNMLNELEEFENNIKDKKVCLMQKYKDVMKLKRVVKLKNMYYALTNCEENIEFHDALEDTRVALTCAQILQEHI
tara:strand:- start:30 stop:551 length:522 start_codon:yes stop_codon:yes gene_type:complete